VDLPVGMPSFAKFDVVDIGNFTLVDVGNTKPLLFEKFAKSLPLNQKIRFKALVAWINVVGLRLSSRGLSSGGSSGGWGGGG